MLSTLIGNNPAKELLKRLINAGRVPNALLFAGPDGVGKKEFALQLARAFVCQAPKDLEACDECPACARAGRFAFPKPDDRDGYKKVILSDHADVGMVIPYNRNILVDAIRELETEAYFRPYEAKARFFIIEDADKMNDPASNALLKTLEEPASTSHIVLISSRPDSLLQTIRSRCQTVRFAPVGAYQIEEFLKTTKKFSFDDARLAAKLSAGSVGRALSTDVEKFRIQRDAMTLVLVNLLTKNDRASLLRAAEEMNDAKNKEFYENNLDILLSLIRDVWTLGLGGDVESIINADLGSQLKQLSEKAAPQKLSGWIDEIELLRESFAVNINKKVATDALFMRMTAS